MKEIRERVRSSQDPIYRQLKGFWSCCIKTVIKSYRRMRNARKLFAHTMLLHHTKELDNNLGARSDEDLALSSLLCIVDGVERIVED
jgi:hypothetical protein